jgi:hypothetical protein
MLRRWQRIQKLFLSGATRYIPKEESYEMFDIVKKYDTCLTWVLNEVLRRKDDPALLAEIQDVVTRCLKD